MFKYVVFAGVILMQQPTRPMVMVRDYQVTPSPTSSTVPSSDAHLSSSESISSSTSAILPQQLLVALEQGNQKEVIKLFCSRWNWIDSWQNYYTRVEHSLEHATQLPAKKTEQVVSFLLSEMKRNHRELPESLLTNAKKNGHTQVVEYFAQKTLCSLPKPASTHGLFSAQCLPHERPGYNQNTDAHGYIIMGLLVIPNLIIGTLLKCLPTDDEPDRAEN